MATQVAALLAALVIEVGSSPGASVLPKPERYSQAVTRICAGALLFRGRHRIGTRAGAIEVSNDIRATGKRRLDRVDALPKPRQTAQLAVRWISLERRLVAVYAWAYLQIWHTIEHATTPRLRAELPTALRHLIDAPNGLQRHAAELGRRLQVPDCTGGNQPHAQPANPPAHR
jgi:hypothetical protein